MKFANFFLIKKAYYEILSQVCVDHYFVFCGRNFKKITLKFGLEKVIWYVAI